MLRFEPFRIGHLKYLRPQPAQVDDVAAVLSNPEACHLYNTCFGISAWEGHRCIGAAGVVPNFAHRAIAWALLSDEAGSHMLAIVRKARRVMDMLPYERIEFNVPADFEEGNRFARLLGMTLETPKPMRKSGMRGNDEYMYAKVK